MLDPTTDLEHLMNDPQRIDEQPYLVTLLNYLRLSA